MEELSTLLKFLINKHEEINHLWEIINDTNPYKGNQNVSHVLENANIIKYIHQYREFIALNETFQEEIKNFILNNFNNVKVIDSSKGNYKALHAYFIKDNKKFMWELQMWNKEDEENNLLSHHKHKQDYIVWEDEEKEAD